ncbi:MAG: oxygenase MpaB family protein [Acidimicrobiales bacterium]
MALNLLAPAQAVVSRPLQKIMDMDRFPQERYDGPPGDPGLFGPDSVTWRLHEHPSLLVGGISSLMLQALHPLAIAGVEEHSDYKERPLQRLSRTGSFVVATIYGSTESAEGCIDVVKAVHKHVHGIAPDGRPYAASDPDLLRWVHVAEFGSFVRAVKRYSLHPPTDAEVDRYYAETAVVAERLGATDVPKSTAEVLAYFDEIRSVLCVNDQSRSAFNWLMQPFGNDPAMQAVSKLLIEAAVDLLPVWARELYGVTRPPLWGRAVVRPATRSLLETMRVLAGPSPIVAEARARCAQPATRAA